MQQSYKRATLWLLFFSTLLRFFLSGSLEFGNDEAYYWLYAKYPDISHFDHPPMVGFFIQFFTANLFFDSELAIRLAAVIPTSASMYLIFLIGNYLKNEKVGFISILLYNIHIYGFIISGTFILPDSPMVFFWLLSFYFFLQTITKEPNRKLYKKILLAFLFTGCAIYSKYQAVFLLFGVVIYVLFYKRGWLKKSLFYAGFIFPILATCLIFYWNYQNDFISYKFHNDRVSLFSFQFNKNSFLREVLGQFLYNNPYIVITLILMVIAYLKNRFQFKNDQLKLFFACSFPLIGTTIYLSMFRDTLPHWSGISYLTLLPLIAVYISEEKRILKKLKVGTLSFLIVLIVAVFVINKGWFLPEKKAALKEKTGKKDVLLDMFGWKQASEKLTKFFKAKDLFQFPIISNKWYPASHIDYYIARPNNMKVYGVGELSNIHKYYWINKEKPFLKKRVLYITDSRNYKDPKILYGKEYTSITKLKVIPIKRKDEIVKYVFLFLLEK